MIGKICQVGDRGQFIGLSVYWLVGFVFVVVAVVVFVFVVAVVVFVSFSLRRQLCFSFEHSCLGV